VVELVFCVIYRLKPPLIPPCQGGSGQTAAYIHTLRRLHAIALRVRPAAFIGVKRRSFPTRAGRLGACLASTKKESNKSEFEHMKECMVYPTVVST
jgi:hypothetical protein